MHSDKNALKITCGQNHILKISKFYIAKGDKSHSEMGHSHSNPEFTLFVRGKAVYKIATTRFNVKSGDVFIVPEGTYHKILSVDAEIEFINVWFEPKYLKTGDASFDQKTGEAMSTVVSREKYHFDSSADRTDKIRKLIEEIYTEALDKKEGYLQIIQMDIAKIIYEILRELNIEYDEKDTIRNKKVIAIEKSMEYICDNLSSNFNLEEIASVAKMSPKYFTSIFKQINGITLWDFITSKKIEMACKLLETSKCSIIDIAFECGFNNTANFNRAFRKVTGKTPTEYKADKKINQEVHNDT